MVTIVGYKKITKENGETFMLLIVQGGVESLRSESTGKMYFTAKTANVFATFDEETCKSLIGSQFEGGITKVNTEPYEYILKTGETVTLSHRYEYFSSEEEIVKEQLVEKEIVH